MDTDASLPHTKRFPVLDGWRGISILLVLACHLLPLGPRAWCLNATAGPMGMSLFFILSGFLITNSLIHKPTVVEFLIRRIFRIVPLAWAYSLVVLLLVKAKPDTVLATLFFYANWPPMHLIAPTSHFWSLCVEMQFYFGIALIVALLKERGLLLIPLLCLAITLYRIHEGILIAVNTCFRLDEILAGGILALIYNKTINISFIQHKRLTYRSYLLPFMVFVISCHPASGFINYFRPYLAALVVGLTLFDDNKQGIVALLDNKVLGYLATISYALYVIHGGLRYTWLGSGDTLARYLKRPLLLGTTFALAHVSTFYYEKRCIAFGKKLSSQYQHWRLNYSLAKH